MRTLGRTGIQVSPFALGTMKFGPYGNPDPGDCVRIIHKALDAGINVIDTADVYGGDGETERIVGQALRGRRDDVVLATKFNGPMGDDPNRQGNSRRWIVTAVEDSLRRLGVEYIDLYQVHHVDHRTDVEETLAALTDLLRAGKVRAIGTSGLPAAEIVEAQWVAERRGLARFRTEQPHYSILNRGIERDVLPCSTMVRAMCWPRSPPSGCRSWPPGGPPSRSSAVTVMRSHLARPLRSWRAWPGGPGLGANPCTAG